MFHNYELNELDLRIFRDIFDVGLILLNLLGYDESNTGDFLKNPEKYKININPFHRIDLDKTLIMLSN